MSCKCSKQEILKVKIKKLTQDAVIPSYAKPNDAGMDMTCVKINKTKDYTEYETGISMEIPEGYAGFLFPRSSNSKVDHLLCNSVGVVDPDYRGPINFRFKNVKNEQGITEFINIPPSHYNVGDRVGQIIILPFPKIQFEETDELSETERGEGGFGSTNK